MEGSAISKSRDPSICPANRQQKYSTEYTKEPDLKCDRKFLNSDSKGVEIDAPRSRGDRQHLSIALRTTMIVCAQIEVRYSKLFAS